MKSLASNMSMTRGFKMKVEDFNFDLPEALIAQTPLENRETSKLLVVDDFNLEDKHFYDVIDYLNEDDVLVLNDTKVLAARLFGIKEETGAHVEVLILNMNHDSAECLVGNARVVKLGTVVSFGDGLLKAKCIEIGEEGVRHFEFIYEGIFLEILDQLGEMPLPPYIHEKLEDKDRYQTVYSKDLGSAAAPTAGLHFTQDLLEKIRNKGIEIVTVTLHVGLGTFRPVKVDDVLEHTMHKERYKISKETADVLNKAKEEGRRIVAVGTTSVRTLETNFNKFNKFQQEESESGIFIYPGYTFSAVDGIITNFHLPKSTLIMMVSAFVGKDVIDHAYKHAIDNKYRFFSFGDSMFITHKNML